MRAIPRRKNISPKDFRVKQKSLTQQDLSLINQGCFLILVSHTLNCEKNSNDYNGDSNKKTNFFWNKPCIPIKQYQFVFKHKTK